MILQALYALAEREELLEDTSFESRPVSFVLRLDRQGEPVAFEPTLDERGKAIAMRAPRAPKRTVAVASSFLVDNAQYVLGMAKVDKTGKKAADPRRAHLCAEAFATLISEASAQVDDDGLRAVGKFLARRDELRDRVLALAPPIEEKKTKKLVAREWTGDENIAFSLVGEDEDCIHEHPLVRRWWSQRFSPEPEPSEKAAVDVPLRCLVTGQETIPIRLHPGVKRVPGGQSSGTTLVCFNSDVFTSHGHPTSDSSGAPVSPRAAYGYTQALSWLLEGTNDRRYRQGVSLGEDSVLLYWTRAQNQVVDVLNTFSSASDEDLRKTVESPWKGLPSEVSDAEAFYALTLGGNSSRLVFRDWLCSTAGEVKRNLALYFDDLRIEGNDAPVSIGTLLRALMARPEAKDKLELPPDLAARLFRCALTGSPFPRQLLSRAVQRLRANDDEKAIRRGDPPPLRFRVALIKACLNRDVRLHHVLPQEVSVSLDPTNLQPAYLLGRLFAVLERMQGQAIGNPNATIRDRYYGAASMTPSVVFPRLLALSMHHAAKLRKDGKEYLERDKSDIMAAMPAAAFPATMRLEEQGLFAVGYYHQRTAFFTKRSAAQGANVVDVDKGDGDEEARESSGKNGSS